MSMGAYRAKIWTAWISCGVPLVRPDSKWTRRFCRRLEGCDQGLCAQGVCGGDEAVSSACGERQCARAIQGRDDAQDGTGRSKEREGSAKVEQACRETG